MTKHVEVEEVNESHIGVVGLQSVDGMIPIAACREFVVDKDRRTEVRDRNDVDTEKKAARRECSPAPRR
jgi:hypothetical protein